jgi:hypothetical protein
VVSRSSLRPVIWSPRTWTRALRPSRSCSRSAIWLALDLAALAGVGGGGVGVLLGGGEQLLDAGELVLGLLELLAG